MCHPIKVSLILLLALVILLSACGLDDPVIEVTRIVATAVPPTSTPTAAALAPVTAAPTQVVPTASPTATATTAVVPTPIPLPSPTPSPVPFSLGIPQILGRGKLMDADFTADGHILAIAWAAGLSLVDSTTAQEIWWQPLVVPPLALDIQPDGEAIALALGDGSAVVVQTAGQSVAQRHHSQQTYPITDHIVSQADIAWSPDESQFAVQFIGPSFDSLIHRVDIATGQINQIPTSRHPQTRPYLVWSPDGRMISVADVDKDCTQFVDVDTGETRFSLALGNDCYASHALAWSPDGRLLGLSNPADTIDLVEPTTSTVVQSISGTIPLLLPWVQTGPPLIFNADGSLLATLSGLDYYGDHPPTVWRTDTGEVVGAGTNHTFNQLAGAFVDGALMSLYEDGTFTRWDFAAQAEKVVVGRLPVTLGLSSFAWSGDGRLLVAGSYLDGLVVWDIATGQERQMHVDTELTAVTLSHDGQWLAGVDTAEDEAQLYEVAAGQLRHTWTGAESDGVGVAFAPDGRTLAYGAGHEVVLVEVTTGVTTAVLTGYPPDQIITHIRWSPDGMALVAGSAEMSYEGNEAGVNILWEQTADGRWSQTFQAEHFYNYGYPDGRIVSFNPTGSLVAFESLAREGAPHQIFVYDRQQTAVILTVEEHQLASWQSDGLLLAVEALGDSWLTQWNVHTGEKVAGAAKRLTNIWFAPYSPFFAQITSSQRNVEMRDWLTDEVVAAGRAGRELWTVLWSADGRFLAAPASDGTILIWPTNNLQEGSMP